MQQSPIRGHQHHEKNSPTDPVMADNATPKKLQVQGKAMSCPVPSLFSTLANAAWAVRLPVPHGHQAIIEDKVGFMITTSSPPMLKIDQWFFFKSIFFFPWWHVTLPKHNVFHYIIILLTHITKCKDMVIQHKLYLERMANLALLIWSSILPFDIHNKGWAFDWLRHETCIQSSSRKFIKESNLCDMDIKVHTRLNYHSS